MLLFAAPGVFLVAAVLFVLLSRPRSNNLRLSSWPSVPSLYAQALLSMLTKGKTKPGGKHQQGQLIKVELSHPTSLDVRRLAAFLRLADYPSTQGTVPLMFPIAQSFRLNIQAMVLPAFPFNVVGSILARHSCTLMRAVGADEQLVFSVDVDPSSARTTPKGDTEVDLLSTAWAVPRGAAVSGSSAATKSAPQQQLGEPVWRATLTVIILNPRRSSKGAGSSGSSAVASSDAAPAPTWRVIDTWRLGGDVGRRYGMINGDLNPIHLHPLTSRLFGFKRPIAHALFLMSRVEAALQRAGLSPTAYPAQIEAEFKRPTLLPTTLQCAVADVDGASAGKAAAGVRFAVLTGDGAKEVMVGRVGAVVGAGSTQPSA